VVIVLKKFLKWSSRAGGANAWGTLLNIVVVGGIWAVMGVVVVKLIQYANTMGLSADASYTVYALSVAFWASGFLFLIASIINHWIVAKSEANMQV
jgi:hypothetical protein